MEISFTERLERLIEKLDEFGVECNESGFDEQSEQVQSAIASLNEVAFEDEQVEETDD
ncbi:hypothetical protein SBA7_880005 [Candidatus Sulfotelmatobacter sp. SbA7]|nr:hypothetical protein SBA7_880005 [Candidatus Sulfotelmatobacter sp. SbA7]